MKTQSYLFQSPYSSQVQIGRPDPNVQAQTSMQEAPNQVEQSVKEAQSFKTSQQSEVKPSVTSPFTLDTYA